MRAIVPLLLILSALPLATAGPVDATDCDDKGPRSVATEGCSAFAYDPATGTYAACGAVLGHSQGGTTGPIGYCSAGGAAGWAGVACRESRWSQERGSETTLRQCAAGAGDASGKGAFVSCTEGASTSPTRNVTWHECFLAAVHVAESDEDGARDVTASSGDLDGDGASDADSGCSLRNLTTIEPTKLEVPDLRCGASTNGSSYATYGVMKAMRLGGSCALSGTATDPDVACGDQLAADTGDLDGDGAPDATCRSEGNVTTKQKQWLPANFRCGVGDDDDGDGAPDTAVACASDGASVDDADAQRCSWSAGDVDGDGSASASARNGTFTATATFSDGSSGDLRCAPPKDGAAGNGGPACATATKWKVYTPLPTAFSSGACDAGSTGAWAACSWDGPAGNGFAAHHGAPPSHSNVVLADLDRDGRPELVVEENGGAATVFATAAGCFATVGLKPGAPPAARSCLA